MYNNRIFIKKISFTYIPIFLLFFILLLSIELSADYDKSMRIHQNFNGKINNDFTIKFYLFQQIDQDISSYDYSEMGVGLNYTTPLNWLAFLLYYQQSYSMNEEGVWLLEKKPSINLNLSRDFSIFRIYNQIRYEYRMTPEWTDFRIKNYLKISLFDLYLKPYIGWELFYEDHYKDIKLSRVKLGISKNIYEAFSLGIYCRGDLSNKDEDWEFTKMLWAIQFIVNF